jgi:hypothetical protein
MSKSLSVLTGIDYWLENLMNDIPEIEICYHINGIVQKYERVKTEDIPCLNGSTFSPNIINDNMQKIILFLRSSTIVGHTHWLFKGIINSLLGFFVKLVYYELYPFNYREK